MRLHFHHHFSVNTIGLFDTIAVVFSYAKSISVVNLDLPLWFT
jgi:hypothetical protein